MQRASIAGVRVPRPRPGSSHFWMRREGGKQHHAHPAGPGYRFQDVVLTWTSFDSFVATHANTYK
jgi:hypothetical protein